MAFASKKLKQSSVEPQLELPPQENLVEDIPMDFVPENTNTASQQTPAKTNSKQLDLDDNEIIIGHSLVQNVTYSTYSGKLIDAKQPKPIEYPNFFIATILLDDDSRKIGIIDEKGKVVNAPINIKIVGNAEPNMLKDLEGGKVLIKGLWIHNTYGSSLDLSKHGFITYPPVRLDKLDWAGFLKVAKLANLPNVGKVRLSRFQSLLQNATEAVNYLNGEKDHNGNYKLGNILNDIAIEELPKIIEAWKVFSETQRDVLFLLSIGLSQDMARSWVEIHKNDLNLARENLKKNPWSLVELDGVGFKKADEIALGLGFSEDHPKRLREALIFGAKNKCFSTGNTQITEHEWLTETIKLLKIPSHHVDLLDTLREIRDKLVKTQDSIQKVPNTSFVSPINFYTAEARLALYFAEKAKNGKPIIAMDQLPQALKYIAEAQLLTGRSLDESQLNAVLVGLTSPIAVMTGGPGAGKTTTLQVLSYVAKQMGKALNFSAPTGKAAKRMNEQIQQILPGEDPKTVHRALGFKGGSFERNQYQPMMGNSFIMDESSMLDAELACSYVQAVPQSATLLFVGDVNQLSSVSPGAVLKDLIDSGVIPVARLTGNHRSKDVKSILESATLVLEGRVPTHKGMVDKDGFCTVQVKTDNTTKNPNKVAAETLIKTVKHLLDTGALPDQIQVLIPMHGTDVSDLNSDEGNPFGTVALNTLLRPYFNPNAKLIESGAFLEVPDGETDRFESFCIGDRILITQNCYDAIIPEKGKNPDEQDLALFNGDMGYIKRIVLREPRSTSILKEKEMASKGIVSPSILNPLDNEPNEESYIEFDMEDGRNIKVSFEKTKKLKMKPGIAITVHKSQGSERDYIITGLSQSHRIMLNRNIAYTGFTRAKKRSIAVVEGKAMEIAVKNFDKRQTGLATYLKTAIQLKKEKLNEWVLKKGILNQDKKEEKKVVTTTSTKSHHFAKKI
jgi:exodeoxyribonuclease V alpha subunit